MEERLTGKGVLTNGNQKWNVDYDFVITTELITRHGFPPVSGHSTSIGSVTAAGGARLPDGYYQLATQDGESIRVKNNGLGQWTILAPL